MKLNHTGSSIFIVHLLDEKGNIVDYLASANGSFQGTKAVGIKQTGNYVLSIQADGNWSISIESQ